MAFNLPVEGEDGPYAGGSVVDVPTCRPDEKASDIAARLGEDGADRAVVVNATDVVLGVVELEALEKAEADAAVSEAMKVSPSTVRPSVLLDSIADGGEDPVLVTSSDGRLLGAVEPQDAGDQPSSEMRELEKDFLDTTFAVQEHFGDHEPSEDELRSFLRDRLVEEGRSPEEADELMSKLDDAPS